MGTATTFLALALARMGHEVEILLGSHAPDSIDLHWETVYERAGVSIRPAPESDEPVEPWQFTHARRIELGLLADPPDVAIVHDFGAPAYSALRLRQAGVALADTLFVVFCHGTRRYVMDMSGNLAVKDLRNLLAVTVLERLQVELADAIVSPSAYLLGWMRGEGWRVPERTRVIPYFTRSTATGEPPPAVDTDTARVRRLAFFGRLDEKKGLRLFADGVNALDAKLLDGIELEFLGKPTATWPVDRAEALFSGATKRALRGISFETSLDQHDALARLRRPGTLVVMPTLRENSPNTVYECLEQGIPFIASNVGGIPELVSPDDHARVLFEPTAKGVEAALRGVLDGEGLVYPVRAAFESTTSFERWAEVLELRPDRRPHGPAERVDVVVHRRSPDTPSPCVSALDRQTYSNFRTVVVDGLSAETARQSALAEVSAPFVVFLDEDDVPDPKLLETLVVAQATSGADVVSCGLRVESTLRFFTGQPGALGLLSNEYGTVALIRRPLLDDVAGARPADSDPDWPLLARLAASGARIVSIPLALVTRRSQPG